MDQSHIEEQHIGAFVLVFSGDSEKVLAGKRKNAYKSGLWGFPGGRLHVGESLEKCAKRELYEETRLKATKIDYAGVIVENQRTYNFVHFIFLCRSYTGQPVLAEPEKCEGWEWVPIRKLPSKVLPAHKSGLTMYLSSKYLTDMWKKAR